MRRLTKNNPRRCRHIFGYLTFSRLFEILMLRLRSNQGFLTVGNVKSTDVEWGDWQLFSSTGAAFAPKLAAKLQDEVVKALRLTTVTINYK